MFNSTKLINDYCGNQSNTIIWDDNLKTFGACFLFTLIENPIYLLSNLILSYMIGNLRLPDELDQRIQNRKKIELIFLVLKYFTILSFFLCILIDKLNYYTLYEKDYNGILNFAFKTSTLLFLLIYSFKSVKCFNYSPCRLIALNLLLTSLIIVEIVHLSWIKTSLKIFTFLDRRLIYCYVKLIAIFIYFSLSNFAFFITKRHSLFYESFANYDSSFNLDNPINLNNYKRGLISKTFFIWVQSLLNKAANDQVRSEADIFHLPEGLTSSFLKKRIQTTYSQLRTDGQENDSQFDNTLIQNESTDQINRQSISTINSNTPIIDTNLLIKEVKLRTILWKTYKNELFKVSNFKLIADIFSFLSPILFNQIIDYIDSKDFTSKGFILVFALFVSQIVSSISINLYDFLINNICIKVKSTIVNLVYRKLFSLRTSTLHNNFSNGQLVNFCGIDSEKVANFFSSFFLVFSMPLQVIIALYLLYLQIGYTFIASFIFSILLMAVNKFISYKIALISNKLLFYKDERIKLTTKLITGIKTIKMNNWQMIYSKSINELRTKEIKMLKRKKYLDAVCVYFWAVTPVICSFLTFSTFVLLGNKLTASNVFTSLYLLNMMINPLNSLPWVLTGILESWISVNRIQAFLDLNIDEDILKDQQMADSGNEQHSQTDSEDIIIEFDDLVCEHKTADVKFLLGPIDLKLKRGEFLGVIGQIGSGKSSFLEAILNEVSLKKEGYLKSGKIVLNLKKKGIGYISQIPWLQNDTVRNNILFGKNYEYKFYNEVIDNCELRADFEVFSDYDNTMISDRGLSLSGGQKARIALARALYQNFDLYLIDDPFISLDQNVAKNIYENCILKFLSSKTRIVCTNQYEYLKNADRIIFLENGCVKRIGRPEEVLNEISKNPLSTKLNKELKNEKLSELTNNLEHTNYDFKEEFNKGAVKLSIYTVYLKAVSIPLSLVIILFIALMQLSRVSSDLWNKLTIDIQTDSMYYLKIFSIIVLVNSFLAAFRAALFAFGCIKASVNLYRKLYATILNSKLTFFNSRPLGQIINRFSSDIWNIDENLPFTLNIFLANLISVIATIIITGYSVPFCLLILVLLCFPYYKIQFLYRQGSTVLKRISTNTLSPLYSQFHETLLGLTTIRSFRASKRFLRIFEEKVDTNNSANYSLKACTQWLNLRIQLIGILLSSTIALVGCLFHYYGFVQQTSLIGLGLVYSLSITNVLHGLISGFTQLEIDFISVERLVQYFDNSEKEAQGMIKLIDFPKKGEIIFDNVTFKYKNDSNYALNSVSFKIHSRSFVGILGRTGSGKSTIFSLLFRMYDLLNGSIQIDDQNIKLLHVDTLRNSMYILSQDPFLFDGTIRDNLDPRKKLTDLEIWKAIDACDAKAIILKLGGLNSIINDQDSNLSLGEKQLICIIRALLCQVKILCLDEATSCLDQEMESKITKTIKKAFANSTVLMISHRPSSCMNCDYLMVLSDGKIVEYDRPDKLICDNSSTFHKMWLLAQNKVNK